MDDDERDARPVIGYLAYFEYLNGFKKSLYWSKTKMMNHADEYSPAFSAQAFVKLEKGKIPQEELWKYSSFWYKNFDEMAKKTMLRQILSKWGMMSIELQQAYVHDSQFIQMNESGSFVGDYEDPIPAETPTVNNSNDEAEQGEPQKVSLNDL